MLAMPACTASASLELHKWLGWRYCASWHCKELYKKEQKLLWYARDLIGQQVLCMAAAIFAVKSQQLSRGPSCQSNTCQLAGLRFLGVAT